MDPAPKGAVAETAIAFECAKLGFEAMRPLIEGRRYDFVIDTNRTLLRAQVKWGRRLGDVIVVNTRTCRSTPSGYVRTTYSADEIDGFAV